MAELKKFKVTLQNGATISVEAKDKLEAQRIAISKAYAKETSPEQAPDMTVGRAAGLGARALVEGVPEGVLGIPALAGDVGYNIAALGQRGYLSATGSKAPPMEYGFPVSKALTDVTSGIATGMGLPEPETPTERIVTSGLKGGISALTGVGGAAALAGKLGPGIAKNIATGLAAGPKTQIAAGIAAPTTVQSLIEGGADPRYALGAGLLMGVGAPIAIGKGAQTIGTLVRPMTRTGQEAIVGSMLRRQTSDPEAAIRSLVSARETVPGSAPTTGAVSADYGLMNLERGARRLQPVPFAERAMEQNVARNEALLAAGGAQTEKSIEIARQVRREKADESAYSLFDSPEVAGKTTPITSITQTIDAIGKTRAADRVGVQEVIAEAKSQLKNIGGEKGPVNPGRLYSVRQNLQDIRDGRLVKQDNPNARLAQSELKKIIASIDKTLEEVAPGYEPYMEELRTSAKKIASEEAASEIYKAASGGPEPVSGMPILSLPKLKSSFNKLSEDLTETQKATMTAVIADMEQAKAIDNQFLRQAGSDTLQNITIANIIGKLLGGADTQVAKNIGSKFSFLYKYPEERVQEIFTQAMLDPAVAAQLLRKATPGNLDFASSVLAQAMASAASGTGAAVRQTESSKSKGLTVDVTKPSPNWVLSNINAIANGDWVKKNYGEQMYNVWKSRHPGK